MATIKFIGILFVLFFNLGLFNLLMAAPNISVTIDGATYQCTPGSGTPVSCYEGVNTLTQLLTNCGESYNGGYERAQQCINQHWPLFRQSHDPSCVYQGRQACYDFCLKYYNGGYERTGQCSSLCR